MLTCGTISACAIIPLMNRYRGFTIVELMVVIIIIVILAGITTVSYSTWRETSAETQIKSDLHNAATALESARTDGAAYPTSLPSSFTASEPVTITLTRTATDFCLQGTSTRISTKFYIKKAGDITEGTCPALAVEPTRLLQTITKTTCPGDRTLAKDARDNHTYWVKRLNDGRCWLLTNLAYAGGTDNGGVATYGDVIPKGNGTGSTLNGPDNAGAATYTAAKYYIPTNANPTLDPATPSVSVNGGSVGGVQYGYLYNWCAAMGAQSGTDACQTVPSITSSIPPNINKSICPAGWRLPTGNSGGEYEQLYNTIGGSMLSLAMLQRGGSWTGPNVFTGQTTVANYWATATTGVYNNFAPAVYYKDLVAPVSINMTGSPPKSEGYAVRCLIP